MSITDDPAEILQGSVKFLKDKALLKLRMPVEYPQPFLKAQFIESCMLHK
jgi:hypothetical protein